MPTEEPLRFLRVVVAIKEKDIPMFHERMEFLTTDEVIDPFDPDNDAPLSFVQGYNISAPYLTRTGAISGPYKDGPLTQEMFPDINTK